MGPPPRNPGLCLLGSPRPDDSLFFFFFQAEGGIRDLTVTGVQTCALPICRRGAVGPLGGLLGARGARGTSPADTPMLAVFRPQRGTGNGTAVIVAPGGAYLGLEIGRAAWRGRG